MMTCLQISMARRVVVESYHSHCVVVFDGLRYVTSYVIRSSDTFRSDVVANPRRNASGSETVFLDRARGRKRSSMSKIGRWCHDVNVVVNRTREAIFQRPHNLFRCCDVLVDIVLGSEQFFGSLDG